MLSLHVLLQTNGGLIFLGANVALLLISIRLGYIQISLVNITSPFRSLSLKSVLEDIIKEPNWSLYTIDQLGSLELDQPCGDMAVDRNCAKNTIRTIEKIEEEGAVDEEVVII